MKTKLVAIFGIQSNTISAEVNPNNKNECLALLSNGKTAAFICEDDKQARDVLNTIHFYPPIGRDNASHEMQFEFTVEIRD